MAQPTPHILAKATARNAIVAFGAGHGALSIPVERRVAQYLRKDHLYAVGGVDDDGTRLSSVECYNPSTNVWSVVAPMSTARDGRGVAVLGGFLYVVNLNVRCLRPVG
jgi:Kelch motif